MAALTLSLLSRTAPSGRPTVENMGSPEAMSTSIVNGKASTPTTIALCTLASITISPEMTVWGAHHLRDYPGDCELPHGHNWKVIVTVRAKDVDEVGMGIDFKVLKKHVKQVVALLDHRDLNAMEEFRTINPSSEHIARFLFDRLENTLRTKRYFLYSITVKETDTSGLTYYGPPEK
ncbi:unnamed protein product [Cyprideis torosa]|uniref:6-pyruvoyltetrahydropterin synthase n=1 Tax=Cyprideis torosa TaxID=163714 RepID=A0A7R8ZWQ1_9CRUS|nr:unnamed protein product [Cyprideis torosa]CAG0905342.1 unnamed protein product [Cyprideis torosa]